MSSYFRGVYSNLLTIYDDPAGVPAASSYGLYNPGGGSISLAAFANGTQIWRTTDTAGFTIADNANFNIIKEGSTDFSITSGASLNLTVPTGQAATVVVNSVDIIDMTAAGLVLLTAGANIEKTGAADFKISTGSNNLVLSAGASQVVDLQVDGTSIAKVKELGIEIQDSSGYNLSKAGTTDLKISSTGGSIDSQVVTGKSVKATVNSVVITEAKDTEFDVGVDQVSLVGAGATSVIEKTAGSQLTVLAPDTVKLDTTSGTGSVDFRGIVTVDNSGITLVTSGANITKTTGTLNINPTAADTVIQRSGTAKLTVGASAVTLGSSVTSLTSTGAYTIATGAGDLTIAPTGTAIFDVAGGFPKLSAAYTGIGATDLVTKEYVDSLVSGLDPKASCTAATTAELAANFTSSGSTGGTITATANGAISIDGVSLALGNRVLVKNGCTNQTQNASGSVANGIYVVDTVGDGSNPYVMTRAPDADNNPGAEVSSGMYTYIEEGTVNAKYSFILTTPDPITLNTTRLLFAVFSNISGAITGPGSSTLNALVRWGDTGGTVLANSVITLTGSDFKATGAASFEVPTSTSSAFEFKDSTLVYTRVDTSAGNFVLPQGKLQMSGTTGNNRIIVPTNLAAAFKVDDGTNDYLTAVSTTGSLATVSNQDLQFSKGIKGSVTNVTGALTLSETHYIVNAGGGTAYTITLPDATATKYVGRIYRIMNNNSGGQDITVATTSSQLISGASTSVVLRQYWDTIALQSNGIGWLTA